jgi:hypothetical protein
MKILHRKQPWLTFEVKDGRRTYRCSRCNVSHSVPYTRETIDLAEVARFERRFSYAHQDCADVPPPPSALQPTRPPPLTYEERKARRRAMWGSKLSLTVAELKKQNAARAARNEGGADG